MWRGRGELATGTGHQETGSEVGRLRKDEKEGYTV